MFNTYKFAILRKTGISFLNILSERTGRLEFGVHVGIKWLYNLPLAQV